MLGMRMREAYKKGASREGSFFKAIDIEELLCQDLEYFFLRPRIKNGVAFVLALK
jgi:hypothetical protein